MPEEKARSPRSPVDFRRHLLARLLSATGATSAGIALAAGCGGKTGETNQSGVPDRGTPADVSSGGASFGNPGAASGGNAGVLIFEPGTGGVPGEPDEMYAVCIDARQHRFDVDAGSRDAGGDADARAGVDATTPFDAGQCPPFEQIDFGGQVVVSNDCVGTEQRSITAVRGPIREGAQCCYELDVEVSFCGYVGRAFLVDEGFLKATSRPGSGWRTGPAPSVDGLSPSTRRALCSAWEKDGLFEHASVATFSRFAIQLMSVGAPAYLVRDTLAAGDDEIRHAELCFALASAYHGSPLEPDAFPIGDELPLDRDLESIVAETVVEGCIGETLAAMQAAEQLRIATDPAVIAALEATVEDETRHAELAWRVVAWAIAEGGEAVRARAMATFARFRAPPVPAIDLSGVSPEDFARHGRLTPEAARACALDAIERVVRPCAAALFERDVILRRRTAA